MTPQELRGRMEVFADGVIALCRTTTPNPIGGKLLSQLQDAATSMAANYRAACRAPSRKAFVAKLSIALEEADESVFWLQRLSNNRLADPATLAPLLKEAMELTAILGASRRTAAGPGSKG